METLASITLYSVLMLVGLSSVSAMFVLFGTWITDQVDDDANH